MEIKVSTHDWLSLPMTTRLKLREIFHIPKSQGTWVEGSVVRSDGTTHQDLEAITVEKMQNYLIDTLLDKSKIDDFVYLFHACTAKIEEQDKELEPEKVDPNTIILEEWAANLSRMQSQANTLGLTEHFNLLISKFTPYDATRKEVKQEGTKTRGRPPKKVSN